MCTADCVLRGVLLNTLVHNSIVENHAVPAAQFVVKFPAQWLNHVGLPGAARVVDAVLLGFAVV